MGEPVKVVGVNGNALQVPQLRELIERSYADPKFGVDVEEVLAWLEVELNSRSGWIRLFVAWQESCGPCGMSLVILGTDPISPLPWISHFVAENEDARKPLVEASLGAMRERGFNRLSILNATGHSDEAHMRLFREFGTGQVKGSVIVYEMEN